MKKMNEEKKPQPQWLACANDIGHRFLHGSKVSSCGRRSRDECYGPIRRQSYYLCANCRDIEEINK